MQFLILWLNHHEEFNRSSPCAKTRDHARIANAFPDDYSCERFAFSSTCVVLDVRMQGLSGLDWQDLLTPREREVMRCVAAHRCDLRTVSFNADQTSSTAQTLMSTNPSGRAYARTVSSVMSVWTPDAFLGHETQITPSGAICFRSTPSFFFNVAASRQNT